MFDLVRVDKCLRSFGDVVVEIVYSRHHDKIEVVEPDVVISTAQSVVQFAELADEKAQICCFHIVANSSSKCTTGTY